SVAFGHWHLRRDGLQCRSADARDRHPHGARSAARRRFPAGDARRSDVDFRGSDRRQRGGLRRDALAYKPVVSSQQCRSDDLRVDRAAAGERGLTGLLPAGPPRHEGRPYSRATIRITVLTVQRVERVEHLIRTLSTLDYFDLIGGDM